MRYNVLRGNLYTCDTNTYKPYKTMHIYANGQIATPQSMHIKNGAREREREGKRYGSKDKQKEQKNKQRQTGKT